jgi:DNA replication initiation complex subunit (GINS family)
MSRTQSLKEAQKRHASKLRRVEITFTPEEMELYEELKERCEREDVSMNNLIKNILKGEKI